MARFVVAWGPWVLVVWIAAGSLFAGGAAVSFSPVPEVREYPGAVTASSLRFACAPDIVTLSVFFQQQSLPFEQSLVRKQNSRFCHIHYEPSVRGFRALPDDAPLTELHLDVNALSFLVPRKKPVGDTLDMAKAIIPELPPEISLTLQVNGRHPRKLYHRALDLHFQGQRGRIAIRENPQDITNSWVQDYMKSGTAGGKPVILLPRRLWEGRTDYGAEYQPLLDSLSGGRFVRSKLSWEGGDILVASDPREPSKNLILFGYAARSYWGTELTAPEYAYVLRVEFGADRAVDMSGVLPHLDYFLCLVPDLNAVLLAEPEKENFAVARAALDHLLTQFGPDPPAELTNLDKLFQREEEAFGPGLAAVRVALHRARAASPAWPMVLLEEMGPELDAWIQRKCPKNPANCFSPAGRAELLDRDPDLLENGVSSAIELYLASLMPARMFSVIATQLPGFADPSAAKMAIRVEALRRQGFRIIRTSRLGGDPTLAEPWAGISYANAALVGKTLFVPRYGLGPAEDELIHELAVQLPPDYRVVSVFARYSLLRNGGTHCVLGMVRTPDYSLPPRRPMQTAE